MVVGADDDLYAAVGDASAVYCRAVAGVCGRQRVFAHAPCGSRIIIANADVRLCSGDRARSDVTEQIFWIVTSVKFCVNRPATVCNARAGRHRGAVPVGGVSVTLMIPTFLLLSKPRRSPQVPSRRLPHKRL